MTELTCPRCGVRRPLAQFRRWRGPKRALHDTCNVCSPQKRLSEMTPKQRINASAVGRPGAHIMVVTAMNQREADHLRYSVRPAKALAMHRKTRKKSWREAMGARLTKELAWADRALVSAREAGPQGLAWAAFFCDYREVLVVLRERISVKYMEPGPRKVRMNEADPAEHLPLGTLARLRQKYGECVPIHGRRTYRDPWCLSWGQ